MISLVLCVKVRCAIFDIYLRVLDLNWVPKWAPKGLLGRFLVHEFRRWKCSWCWGIFIVLRFERFLWESDRPEHRCVVWWFLRLWECYKNPSCFNNPFWRTSEHYVFWYQTHRFLTWMLGPWKLKYAIHFWGFLIISKNLKGYLFDSVFERCKKHDFEIMRFSLDVEHKSSISMILQGGVNRTYCILASTESKHRRVRDPGGTFGLPSRGFGGEGEA